MYVRCQKCDCFFEIRESRLGPQGRKVRCAFCHNTFMVSRDSLAPGEVEVGLDADEYERTMLLNLWNKPAAPQSALRAQFQREKAGAQLDGKAAPAGAGKVALPPLSLAGMELGADEVAALFGVEAKPSRPEAPPAPLPAAGHGRFWRLQAGREIKAELLAQSGWFNRLPDSNELITLAAPWELYRAEPDADYVRPGQDKRYLAVIIKGLIRLLHPTVSGAGEEVGAILGPGHSFGEITLFEPMRHRNRISSFTESTTLLLSERAFHQLAESHPTAFRHLALELGQRLARCLTRLTSDEGTFLNPSLLNRRGRHGRRDVEAGTALDDGG